MNKIFFAILLSIPVSAFTQNLHPTTADMGCCSEKTAIPIYTRELSEAKELFMLYNTNKYSEKLIFYYGKYDPWVHSPLSVTDLYNQDYITPPGTLPIEEGKFVDQTEVANVHYQEFLFFMVKDSGKYKDRVFMPKQDNKMLSKYFNESEFSCFPVTAVGLEHAETYCKWRAEKLNEGLIFMLEDEVEKYEFSGRLPSEEEWFQAAGAHEDFVKPAYYEIKKKSKQYLEEDVLPNRFINAADLNKTDFEGYNVNLKSKNGLPLGIPMYIYSFEPNNGGFYNMYGNVKELVAEGYAIGGSFLTTYSDENIREQEEIQAYKTDVGFRCLVEIVKK